MTERRQLHPEAWEWSQGMSFSQGVEIGDTVYVAGHVSISEECQIVGGPDDMRTQSQQAFENVETVLAEAGMTLDNVVNLTCYITDQSLYPDYSAVRTEKFEGNLPASATVVVKRLVLPGLLVEIDAVAVRQPEQGTEMRNYTEHIYSTTTFELNYVEVPGNGAPLIIAYGFS
ncbi:MAG: RidA family protein [Dehalococcoidia bacterium]|jgi:enamine deaminase RidA (YjgF/YER057c/UK114 family)|nr:RidA family protein [Dehalococcoidia bacterium]